MLGQVSSAHRLHRECALTFAESRQQSVVTTSHNQCLAPAARLPLHFEPLPSGDFVTRAGTYNALLSSTASNSVFLYAPVESDFILDINGYFAR